ncbi:putative PPM-type phosphatase, divalent cation binding, protein phosphatase 2C family [Helianthus annuus]|uniref:Putative PPM-type phosphatase domain, Protein phosphatase 2C family n=1 Tax=Helianthus annuus TaxID=4232 RepID=A0A251SG03_HELAN|nr:putative protein phosphatase 2C family, PPM-type phosphatase domain superfamily [Helianthus annuus]KAJ0463871.1 putative PPM-type phosphatase, divalent cation binding, PPM-type phosphatase domain superfamily [Helianthus annuus]KAJ0468185.1 putative PPM-type phosphatase, divalent cation binding, protein phosphatase 2C family [Helianthus annuus]KAJ0655926.1 putative PPM-type phosphatase, divalent cation binding, PPM-type phosphatase domain superfamily [Helianthus annuus]KAJ0659600.1 putative P
MKKLVGYGKKVVSCGKKPAVEDDDDTVRGQKWCPAARVEGLWWTRDEGVFSIAMIQANAVSEDQCHLESGSLNMDRNGPRGMFVGMYDGHAGPETAWFIKDRLFENLKTCA